MGDVIEVEGLDELRDLIGQFPTIALDAGEVAMDQTLFFLREQLPPYPDKPQPGEAWKHWTPKQRAWFFANLREGKLKLPYVRSGKLRQSFTTERRRTETAIEGEIGTSAPHAPWVVGPDYPGDDINGQTMYQARIHQDRWWQFDDVIADNREAALDVFEQSFGDEFMRRVKAMPT